VAGGNIKLISHRVHRDIEECIMRLHNGFTRIDLVVTLLCTAFLIVTVGAVGNRGRRRAEQIVCASQLGKWGQAIVMLSTDNDDKVMSIVRRWGGIPMPFYMSTIEDYTEQHWDWDDAKEGEWNAYAINPYLPILDDQFINNGIVTSFVTCPSVTAGFVQDWDRYINFPYNDFIELAYVFWGGADGLDVENCSQSAMNILTLNELSTDRLLMSDVLLLTGDSISGMAYRYNHGRNGWSWNAAWDGINSDVTPFPKATGRNQLFGDGQVRWKAIPVDNNLPTHEDIFFQQYNGMWNGPDSGWVGDQYDITYF
jgi:hypothetical protein